MLHIFAVSLGKSAMILKSIHVPSSPIRLVMLHSPLNRRIRSSFFFWLRKVQIEILVINNLNQLVFNQLKETREKMRNQKKDYYYFWNGN